ncbi:MAG TPA: tetratricopeptide repeat protein [Spirochaetota bacterium]|nr:tetratricopeptide repeat protein [Spirochaetota bacterium]
MSHIPRIFRIILALPPLLILCGSILAAVIDEARAALINREYPTAARMAATENAPAAILLQGNALRAMGRHTEAIQAYDRLTAQHPAAAERAKALFGKASSLMALKRFEEAGTILRSALARLSAPDRIKAQALVYVTMADRLVEPADKNVAPDHTKALPLYTAALDAGTLPPDLDFRIRVSLAKSRLALSGHANLEDARKDLEGLLKKTPAPSNVHKAELRYLLGRVFHSLGRRDSAEHYLTIAARSTNTGEIPLLAASDLLNVLGFPSVNRRELARGRLVVRDVTTRYPGDKRSEALLFTTARAEIHAGEREVGIASLEQCITRWPDGEHAAEALFRSAEALFSLNRHADAMQSLRTLLARFPGSSFWQQAQRLMVDVEFGEAERATSGGEYVRAAELWKGFMARYPLDARTPTAALRLGHTFEKRKDWKVAVDSLQDVWRRWPSTEQGQEACLEAGIILADRLDQYEAAIDLLKKPTIWKFKQRAEQKIRELENESLALSTSGVFPEGTPPHVTLTVRNIAKVRVRIYQLDSEAYFRSKAGFTGMEKLDIELISPDLDFWYMVPDYKKHKLGNVKIPVSLTGPGTWVIQCSTEKLQSSTLLVKSDLGLTVRATRGQVVVQTTHLATGAAVPGATILVSNGKDVFATGTTDGDGIFVSSATNEQAASGISVYARSGKNVAAVSPGWFDRYQPAKPRLVTHLAADRQAWRPGDTVHFRLTLRIRDAAGLLSIPREEYLLTVRTPTGLEVMRNTVTPDRLGTIQGEFVIDPAEAPGVISLVLVNADRTQTATHQLRVEQYTPKETSVEFTQSPTVPLVGDRISLTARCAHLWGEPAAGRHILWRVNQEDWQTAVTDPRGEIIIPVDSAERISGQALTVTVKPSWEERVYTHTINFASRDIALKVTPGRSIWLHTEKPVVEVTLAPIPGADPARKVSLTASLLTNGRSLDMHSQSLTFAGKKPFTLAALRAGNYQITARTTSSSGEEVTARTNIFVSGPQDPRRIHILQDTTEVSSGQALKLRIHSRLPRTQDGILLLERDRIVRQQKIRILPGESVITLFPDEALSPAFKAVVLAATTNGFYTSEAEYALKHAIQLAITPPAAATPGKKVTLRFSTKSRSGEAANSSLFVFVIDDAIWSAVNVSRQDIVSTFFPKLPFATTRSASFTPFTYSAKTGERDPDMVSLERDRAAGRADMPSQRTANGNDRAFRQTREERPLDESENKGPGEPRHPAAWAELAWYSGSLTTGRDGTAEANFVLPDRSASWRVVTVAVSGATLFGDAELVMHAVTTTHARIQAPEAITSGDRVLVPLHLSTRSDKALQGRLTWQLETTNQQRITGGEIPWSLKPASASELSIPLTVSTPGSFILTVRDPAFGASVPLVVHPAGEKRVSGASALVRTVWEKRLRHTPAAISRTLRIQAEHPEAILLEPYPEYFGRNQLSGIIASLVRDTAALEYLKAISPSDALRQNTLRASIESQARHLATRNKRGWESGAPTESEIAWLGFALQRCRAAGVTVDPALSAWTKQRLEQIFSASGENEIKALTLFAMAGGSDSPFAWMNRLYRERARLAPRELALLTLALESAGRRDMSGELVRLLQQAFIRKDGQAHIPGKPSRHTWWMEGSTGTTALAALALTAATSDQSSRTIIGEALAWLDEHRFGRVWSTPAENGIIPLVHARHLIAQASSAAWTAKVFVNGREAGEFSSGRPGSITLTGDQLGGDGTTIKVQVEGRGACRVHSLLSEVLAPDAPPQRDYPGTFEVSLQHPPYAIEGKSIPRGMSILADWTASPTNELARISRGSPFTAEIKVRMGGTRVDELLVVELPVPTGCRTTGLIEGSAVIHRELLLGRVRYLVKAPHALETIRIREGLVAFAEGSTRMTAASCAPLSAPWKRSTTAQRAFVIIPAGSDIFAGYRFSADEMYRIGEWHFNRGEMDRAKALLSECLSRWQLKAGPAREIGLMLLDIAVREKNSREIVRHFESLKEKHQDLSISLEQADAVAGAYARIGEHERSCQVLDGIIEARFLQDSAVSAAWLASNQVKEAAASLKKLWLEYPDGSEEIASISSFAQQLFQMATELSPEELAKRGVTGDWLKDESLTLFDAVLAAAPDSTLAPESAFSVVSLLFEREHWQAAEARARKALSVYTNSHFVDSFRYLLASTLYFERKFAEASRECETVANTHFVQQDGSRGPSRYRDYALHMLGKIRHSEQRLADALKLYEQVKTRFADAARAIEHIRQKTLSLPEITIVPLEEQAHLEIASRNVSSATLTLYKVDFLMLCLKQKDLRNVKGINLAGIRPSLTTNIALGKAGQVMTATARIPIPVRDTGAWLVVVKADGIEQSGMIIRSNLVLDVMTTSDGSVRASLHDRKTTLPMIGAQLKFIPANGQRATTATSDPRGMAESQAVQGSMIVAAVHQGQYAFQRIESRVVASGNTDQDYGTDYKDRSMEGLKQYRRSIQDTNRARWEQNQKLEKRKLELKNLKF